MAAIDWPARETSKLQRIMFQFETALEMSSGPQRVIKIQGVHFGLPYGKGWIRGTAMPVPGNPDDFVPLLLNPFVFACWQPQSDVAHFSDDADEAPWEKLDRIIESGDYAHTFQELTSGPY